MEFEKEFQAWEWEKFGFEIYFLKKQKPKS